MMYPSIKSFPALLKDSSSLKNSAPMEWAIPTEEATLTLKQIPTTPSSQYPPSYQGKIYLLHFQIFTPTSYHQCLWSHPPWEENYLRLTVENSSRIRSRGLSLLHLSFQVGTCHYSYLTLNAQIIHYSACTSYRRNHAKHARSQHRIRCTIFLTESIVIQMDNGSILNDEDLPPLPDKMEKQLKRRLEPF